MRNTLLAILALLLAVPAVVARTSHHSSSISISTDDWEEITSCDQLSVRFDGERATMREEVLPAGNLRSLRGHAAKNGGIRVTGWDRPDWSIQACRATSTDMAGSMRPYLRGDELGVEGEDDDNLTVIFFLIRAPRNAVLNLDAHNGELGIQGVSGTLTARTQNGPISLKEVSGNVDAEAQNGPISFAGNAGKVHLEAQNGPVSVKLTGSSWSGTLDASTHNGPLSLKIPRDYRSGVVVESDGHGPISCRAEACRQARRTWGSDDDDDNDSMRRIELGSGAQNVRMSTTNGPVSVKEER
ncbi:MAG TPA: hypothetical protein VGR02_18045 [Thermoanaerobaculia bacterium]|jgi:hypothetical protein|nr:hypothetical protein [Thermoanaerobaculia bacterium]